MKIIAMLLTAIMAFFSWIASPFLPDKPERTDFIVDGKYWGFSTSEKTMSNFLRLTDAEDADTIYEIFSPAAREEAENLKDKIPEVIEFFNEDMISWESTTGYGEMDSIDGLIMKDSWDYLIYTDNVNYCCTISNTKTDINNSDNEGFYSIAIYPEELYLEYSRLGYDETGIFHKKLTIKPDKEQLEGEGVVTLTTSLPATVTCDRKYIEVTQKDAYTWEAVLPTGFFDFTATTKDESVTCRVYVDDLEDSLTRE